MQLWGGLDALAEILYEAGIGARDTVAVLLSDGVCGVISLLGVSRICACAPLNPALTSVELKADLLELGAVAVVVSPELETPRVVVEMLGLLAIECAYSDSEQQFLWTARKPSTPSIDREAVRPENGGAAILLHTSATTGRRKLVPLSLENLSAMIENTVRALKLGRDDRLLMMARIFHTQGVLSPFAQLLAGGSVIVPDSFTPQDFRRCLNDLHPTWYTCGPTLHRAILTNLEAHPLEAPTSLRFVRSGGAPLPKDLRANLEQALQAPVLDVYGLTETGAVACTRVDSHRLDSDAANREAVGKTMGPEIAIMGPEGELLPPGTEGEIVVAGPTVISGYLNDLIANDEAYRGRWFRSGDLGRLDPEGFLYITGRLKEIINRGGQKIIPNEIDAVLVSHEAVLEAAAFGVPHPTLGEDVACAVVLSEEADISSIELRVFAAKRLAAFKVPRKIYRVESIPHGATGKPQRLMLRKRFSEIETTDDHALLSNSSWTPHLYSAESQRSPLTTAHAKPKDIDRTIEDIWSRTLRTDSKEQHEDFFSLGGDSLAAVTMLVELEVLFDLKTHLPQALFFEESTLATLIDMVRNGLAGRDLDHASHMIELVQVTRGRGQPPLFMIPADGEEGSRFRRLSRKLGEEWPLSLVRPADSWHERSARSIEEAGARSTALIRAASPQGPYVVGGFCSGGIVAFEIVCQLEREGQTALLVLFDVPTPGFPHLFNLRPYLRAAYRTALHCWRMRNVSAFIVLGRRILRRLAWFAIRSMRPWETKVGRTALARWLCDTVQANYFSYYYPGTTKVPVLHIMSRDVDDVFLEESRQGWRILGLSGVSAKWLTGDHDALFNEANLPLLAHDLSTWISNQLQLRN
jgi:acyl-CoA synthetase (AMP-forming)/AMP-acid ligase II/thioesterase domain-containing protein/acyl carrier protein